MKFARIIIFVFIIAANCFAQLSDNRVVAWIGNKPIYEREFLKRYEMTPQFGQQAKNNEQKLKLDFLYTLIAEKLWAQNAIDKNCDSSSAYKTAIYSLEKMYARDALYRNAILDSIKISNEEIFEGLKKLSLKYNIKYIQTPEKSVAENIYKLISSGFPIDSLPVKDPAGSYLSDKSEVTFGDMIPSVEDSVYRISKKGITKPIKVPEGWFLFYVYGIESNNFDEKTNTTEIVKSIIKKRKETVLYNRFLRNVFGRMKVDFQKEMFDSLLSAMTKYITEKCVDNKEQRKLPFFFSATNVLEFQKLLNGINPERNFILFDENPITFKQFMRELFFGGLTINTSGKKGIAKLLNSKVFDYIEKELLAREAYKRGYQNYPSVIEEIAMWKDYYLQQTSLSNEMKIPELNDSTLYAYYQKKQKKDKTEMMKVKYFFHNDIRVVKGAFEKMKAGIDLSDLDTEQSLVYSSLAQDEWFPEFQIQQLLNIKESLLENELYGPVQTDGGFLLVKVKEKQIIKTGIQNYDDVKSRLKNELAAKLGRKELMNKTAGLASRYKVKIDYKVLNELKPTNINMFTIRKMGFGGSISGVPIYIPNNQWVDLLNSKQLLP
jgi:parvulin-like peptidyl-prolyl isomerase